jgi:predicted nucleic acid-binding protein
MEVLARPRPSLSLVLDSSATLAWIYAEETTQDIREVFDTVTEGRAFVPSLWRLEVANSLTGAMRRGRIGAEFRRAALADLAFLDIIVDDQTDSNAWGETLALADRFRMTVYDAAYVELAARRRLPLATLDAEMRAAGAALGLQLLGAPRT